jgi:tRNA threonylcarbamoyladenosine biosynthesis protein TsaE
MVFYTKNSKETVKVGEKIANLLRYGDIVSFSGELGSGKTTMIKGIVFFLTGKIATSPTFVILNEYNGKIPVFHFDLYRIEHIEELSSFGWEEYLGKGIILVEWAERIKNLLPLTTILINIEYINEKRKISISGLEERVSSKKINHNLT